jgi:hypothetical protein
MLLRMLSKNLIKYLLESVYVSYIIIMSLFVKKLLEIKLNQIIYFEF